MKAIRFFLAVFVSMLLVFLLATGEVKRWLSKDKGLPTQLEIAQRESSPRAPKNLIEFPFYDVDQGKLLFVIKAEFSQEEFQQEKKIEDIRELNLKNGIIEVPISDDNEAGVNAERGSPIESRNPEARVKSLVLEFRSAFYQRRGRTETGSDDEASSPARLVPPPRPDSASPAGVRPPSSVGLTPQGDGRFEVLLKDGRGTTNEGTEFFFEELVFTNEPPKSGEKSEGAFLLHSSKPASIQNPSFALSSPSGFRGTLKGHGLENFTFLPPVGALIDPSQASILNLDAGLAGTQEETEPQGGGEPGSRKGDASSAKKTAENPEGCSKVAVKCLGPLTIVFEDKKRDANPPKPPAAFVRFQKDVVLYSANASDTVASLPAPQGNRFECQFLELELENAGTEFRPRRAVATASSPDRDGGGRVKAVLFKEGGGPPYTLDGERLEWTLTKRPDGSSAAASPLSEAILYGNPTLRGEGMIFNGERAVFHLSENRVVLESVEGSLDYLSTAKEDGRKRKLPGEALMAPTPLESWEDGAPVSESSLPGGQVKSAGALGTKAESSTKPNVPQLWSMKADEVEFFFQSLSGKRGGSGSEKDFSRFVARSVKPDGVLIESRPPKEDKADSGAQRGFRATGKALSYIEAEKKATLEGTAEVKPRFSQGDSWIEAQRINLLLEERVVWFVEDVKASVKSLSAMGEKGKESRAADASPAGDASFIADHGKKKEADKGPGAPATSQQDTQLDGDAAFLAVRFQGDKTVRDLLARGAPGAPVRVTCSSTQKLTFVGSELYWDEERELAQLVGQSTEAVQPSLQSQASLRAVSPDGQAASPPTADGEEAGESKVTPGKGTGEGEMARLEFDGGELMAQRMRFQQKTWKAFLTDRVTIRTFEKTAAASASPPPQSPAFEVSTGKAEVEFFPELKVEGPPREGTFRHLGQIKSFHAQRAPGGPIELRGKAFAGRADESTWDAGRRELRFYGNGEQEIEILREDFKGPIRAREILYDEEKSLATLRGNVHGSLVQSAQAGESRGAGTASSLPVPRVVPAAHGPAQGGGPMVWQFDTSVLEIQLRQETSARPDSSSLSFVSLRARDKVFLRNDELGIQLRGDDLIYDDATRKVRIFSLDGRPQTLLCDKLGNLRDGRQGAGPKATAGKSTESSSDKVHKIVAQEICLLIYENPYALPQRGEPKAWLLVEFQRDVIGSFYMPNLRGGKEVEDLGDVWKMVAEKLTLLVDPSKPFDPQQDASARKLIPWAVAKGNVVFSSGSFQATADRAIYEDPTSTLTLIGSPARLSQDNKPRLAEPEILIRKVGGKVGLEYGKPDKPPQLPSVGDLGK
jgi:hypothetical protein